MVFKTMKIFLVAYLVFSVSVSADHDNNKNILFEQYRDALRLIGQAKYEKALDHMKEILKKDSKFFPAYSKILEILKYQGKLDSAGDYFEISLLENKKNSGVLYGLGLYYAEKEDFHRAVEFFKQAIQLTPDSHAFYSSLIVASKKINQLPETENYIKTILDKNPENAMAYFGMASLFYNQQDWEKAAEPLEKALKLASDKLVVYRLKCDLFIAMNKYKELLEFAPEKAGLCENPDLQIDFFTRISKAYNVLGQYQKALEFDEKALNLAKEIGNKKSEGALLGNIGVFYANTGQLQNALEYFFKKLAIVKEIKDKGGESHILMNIGALNDWMGNYKDSLIYYKQALELNKELDNPENKGLILGNIGAAYEKLSEYNKALGFHDQALEIFQKIKNKRYSAWVYMNIGALIYKLGMQEKALENLKKALQIVQEIGEKSSEGMILGFIGTIYNNEDGLDKSREYLIKALEISREIGDKRTEIMHLGNLGSLYLKLKEYKKADEVLTQGKKLAEQVGDTLTGTELLVISGILYREQKEHQKSVECFQKTLSKGTIIRNPRIMWNSEWGLALTYEEMKKYKEAIKHYRNSIDVIESVRGKLQSGEQKAGFLKEKIKIYEGLINLLVRQEGENPGKGYIQESFHIAERARSRAFLDLLAESEVTVATGLSEELRREEEDLQGQLTNIQQKLLNPQVKAEERKGIYKELQSIESNYSDFILKVRTNNPKYASLIYPEPYTLEKVQNILLDDKTFIFEFFIGEENSFVWLISRDKIIWSKSYPSSEKLFDKITSYQTQISRRKLNLDFKLGEELFGILLKEGLEQVPVLSNLVIIPDGLLLRFPFEVLVIGMEKGVPRYLLEDYSVAYAPSASVLGVIKMLEPAKTKNLVDLMAIGNPFFGEEEEKAGNTALEFVRSRGVQLESLPYAEEEVLAIQNVYEIHGKSAEVYVQENATENIIKSGKTNQYKIFHFATHGLIDDRFPALSGLLLSPGKEPEGEDGFLRLNEIFNLNLNCDLVTLSACETALGKEIRGEGIIGLIRAFFYAGARSVIASLWMVSDRSTSKLMEEFYINLVAGNTPRQALRLAKLKLLKGDEAVFTHPFFWAPFVVMNGDR
jgi:CHAT domain-containing protein/Tfp pilus assembly protein PilF